MHPNPKYWTEQDWQTWLLEDEYRRAESMRDEKLPRIKARAVLLYLSALMNRGLGGSSLRARLSDFELFDYEADEIWDRLQWPSGASQATAPAKVDRDAVTPTAELMRDFAAELEKLKLESELTWAAIAAETGVSERALTYIKTGKTKIPTDVVRKAIADFFTRELDRPVKF